MAVKSLTLSHLTQLWFLHGFAFRFLDAVLFMDIRHLTYSITSCVRWAWTPPPPPPPPLQISSPRISLVSDNNVPGTMKTGLCACCRSFMVHCSQSCPHYCVCVCRRYLKYRSALSNLNDCFPDVSSIEGHLEKECAICREKMQVRKPFPSGLRNPLRFEQHAVQSGMLQWHQLTVNEQIVHLDADSQICRQTFQVSFAALQLPVRQGYNGKRG